MIGGNAGAIGVDVGNGVAEGITGVMISEIMFGSVGAYVAPGGFAEGVVSVTSWLMFEALVGVLAITAIVDPPMAVPAITRLASAELGIPIGSPSSHLQPKPSY